MSVRLGKQLIAGSMNLDNKQDVSTAVNYDNITNCITEISQDIKLELNNGTLTLKAGSKVYVPNGFESDGTTKKFDVVITDRDVSIPKWDNSVPGLISITSNREIWIALPEQQYSGNSAPTSQWALWYDTTNNIIKSSSNAGSSWKEGYCLPIAICTSDSSKWTSIDQVFNGFGYIGSTVFALPGVKGLIPNYRNADGSLKNIEFVNDRVRTFTASGSGYGLTYFLNPDYVTSLEVVNSKAYAEKDTKLTNFDNNYGIWFDTKQNIMLRTVDSGATCTRVNYVSFSHMFMTNVGHLDYLESKTVFHALDYNDAVKYSDRETVVGWSIPDYNAGITLTFNKVITHAGESKTMTKSGLFCFEFLANNVISTLYFYVNNNFVGKIGNSKTSVAFWDEINFPVTKGDVVKVMAETDSGFTAAAVESYLFPYKGSMYE